MNEQSTRQLAAIDEAAAEEPLQEASEILQLICQQLVEKSLALCHRESASAAEQTQKPKRRRRSKAKRSGGGGGDEAAPMIISTLGSRMRPSELSELAGLGLLSARPFSAGSTASTAIEEAELLWSCCRTPSSAGTEATWHSSSPDSRKRPFLALDTAADLRCETRNIYPSAIDALLAFRTGPDETAGPPTPSSTSAAGALLLLAPEADSTDVRPSALLTRRRAEQGDAAAALLALAPICA